MKPLRPCGHPGCPELVQSGRCAKHTREKEQRRGSAASRGYSGQWVKVRDRYLKQFPLCYRCQNKYNRVTAATLVHHIKRIRDAGPVLDTNNLMSLCVKCHDEIHRDQGDKW